ncbi:MAG: MFS transporter [Acidimicrobiia bacterium]
MSGALGARQRWVALMVLIFSLMVIGIDGSILNVALPTLSRDLHATTSDLQWMVDAYILVFAGLLLTAGSLGDRFGRRGALVFGLVVFGTASAAAAFSSTTEQVIVFRALMGVGAAFMMPATLSIITNIFTEPRERARAFGVWAAVSAIGSALGPVIGGLLLAHFWWGSVFLVNVPIVMIVIPMAYVFVPTSRDPHPHRLDLVGSLLSIVGLSVLLWAIIGAPDRGWLSGTSLAAFVAAAIAIGAFVLWELHNPEPMLDMTFFRNPRFTVASLAIMMAFFAVVGGLFLNSQMYQIVFGYSPLETGVRLLPFVCAYIVAAFLAPRIAESTGSKWIVAGGLTVAGVGLLVQAGVHVDSSYFRAIIGLIVMASGMGLATPSATESIMGSLPKEKAGVGSAMNDTTRQMGGALGVAVMGSILASQFRSAMSDAVGTRGLSRDLFERAHDSAVTAISVAERVGGPAGEALLDVARHSWLQGKNVATVVAAVMVLAGALLSFLYLPAQALHHHLNPTEYLPTEIVIDDDEIPDPDDGTGVRDPVS